MNLSGREIAVFVIVVLLVLLGGLFLLGLLGALFGFGMNFGHMTGPGMMGPGSVGPRTGFAGMGILWLLLICLLPLGLLALLVVGVVWYLGDSRGSEARPEPREEVCPDCGERVQSDWQLCPHCGTSLEGETT